MGFSIYSILPLMTSFCLISFGTFVLIKNYQLVITRTFFLLCASTALWAFGYSLMYASTNPLQALFWARIGYLGVIYIPISLFHFTLSFLKIDAKRSIISLYVFSIFWIIISQTDYFLKGMRVFFWGY